jgi:hypothetical protein
MENDITFYSLREAARYMQQKPQSIFSAIKKGRLKALKSKKGHLYHWIIKMSDIQEYKATKYQAATRTKDGKKIYDIKSDRWNIVDLARDLSIPAHRIYYLIRVGKLRAERNGASYIVKKDDLLKILEQEMVKVCVQ